MSVSKNAAAKIDGVQADTDALQIDTAAILADTTIIKADGVTLKADTATLKADTSTLKADTTTLKADTTTLKADVTTIDGLHDVPAANSTANALMRDAIGTKTDLVQVPYVDGQDSLSAYARNNYYHIHGEMFVYPDHANDVTLTAGTGAWDLTGAITQVIPASTITEVFDIHWINISNISGNGTLQVDIYSGAPAAEVLIGSTRASRSAVFSQEGPKRIQIPQQLANARISCRLSDSTAGALTCTVSFEGHLYA